MSSADGLEFLVRWYRTQCDGDWEHQYGVSIESLDNPGWLLRVDISQTPLAGTTLARVRTDRSETDWVQCTCDGVTFQAACGPGNLEEALDAFRRFAESRRTL
jgi:hypothetical protein